MKKNLNRIKNRYLNLQNLILLCLITASGFNSGCRKSDSDPLSKSESKPIISESIIQKLKIAGFDTSQGLRAVEDGYLVEYDIFLMEDQIDSLSRANKIDLKGSKSKLSHYRTNNLVLVNGYMNGSRRTIKIYIEPLLAGGELGNGLDLAISRFNEIDLSLVFERTSSQSEANISIVGYYEVSGELGYSGFPSGGEPYGTIKMNVFNYPGFGTNARNDAASVIAHEIGHTIGFRHSDYMNRTFSCGGGGNEGAGNEGAIYLDGTPGTPGVNSWMLACSANFDRPFTQDDIIALKSLYAYRKPIYIKRYASLISDNSNSSFCCDHVQREWGYQIRFFQDPNYQIPYTLESPLFLKTEVWSSGSPSTQFTYLPSGVSSFDFPAFVDDVYYEYGNETQNNSNGTVPVAFIGYYGL